MFTKVDRQSLIICVTFPILKVLIIWSGIWFRVASKTGYQREMYLKERLDCELEL